MTRGWLLLALALPYLFFLSSSGLIGPDEPRYAAIGLEMASSGDWITPRLWGSPWFEKPPLTYWLIAVCAKAGAPPDLAARLPIALLGLAFLLLLPTVETALVLGTTVGWFALSGLGVTDLPLAVTFNAWLLLLLRGKPWAAGCALGLAVLAKGLVPLVFAIPVAALYWREWRPWVSMLATALPWYVICYARNGNAFFEEFILRHHIQRFLSPELQHVQPFWFYIPVLLGLLMPWAPALAHLRWRPEAKPFFATFVFGFLFLSASRNKLPAYLLPLIPSLVLMLHPFLKRWHYSFAAAALILLPAATPWLPQAIAEGLSRANLAETNWLWFVLAPAAAFAAWRYPQHGLLLAFAVSIVALKWNLYPALAANVSARDHWLRHRPACIAEDSPRGFRYSLFYYANRELPACLEPDENVPPLQAPDNQPR
jgi:4-amino-4-deoxy-L-arabinose transferase-like glycosyltransferase